MSTFLTGVPGLLAHNLSRCLVRWRRAVARAQLPRCVLCVSSAIEAFIRSLTDPFIGPLAFVGRAGVVRTQAAQLPVRDAEQLGHLVRLQAGAEKVLYRLGLGALSFGLGALPGGFGLGKSGHGPGEQTRRGSTGRQALLRGRRLLGSELPESSYGRVVANACYGLERRAD